MQVIMTTTGEVKQVPDGYARNYLFPKRLAKPATAESVKAAEAQSAQQVANAAARQAEFAAIVAKLNDMTITYSAKASETGRLFKAVHPEDIMQQLGEQGIVVPPQSVTVPPIKQIGDYQVIVRLPGQTAAHLSVHVSPQ